MSKLQRIADFLKKNPLCGMNLQVAAYFVVVAQMLLSFVEMILFLFHAHLILSKSDVTDESEFIINQYALLLLLCGYLFQGLWFTLNLSLLIGIHFGNYKMVDRIWIFMVGVILGVMMVKVVATLLLLDFAKYSALEWMQEIGNLGLDLVTIWVVAMYKKELDRGADMNCAKLCIIYV